MLIVEWLIAFVVHLANQWIKLDLCLIEKLKPDLFLQVIVLYIFEFIARI